MNDPRLELHFEQVSDAMLALLVDEVLALREAAAAVLGHLDGLALGHHD